MGIREDALALADELEGMDCRTCPADGTKDCRDLPCEEAVARAAARRIREVVEHDACEDTTVSAYDLLPDDDRKAIAWVREHGGLYTVEKRLMPPGMEWPTVDGKPVDFVTGYEPSLGYLEAVSIYSNGACEVMSHYGIVKNATEIYVSKPKVLDADGVEIRVGDTVYVLGFGEPLTVKGFTDDGRVLMSFHGENSLGYKPSKLTHEQTDTWERLEDDARQLDIYLNDTTDDYPLMSCCRDLVRRCRALVEKENRNE